MNDAGEKMSPTSSFIAAYDGTVSFEVSDFFVTLSWGNGTWRAMRNSRMSAFVLTRLSNVIPNGYL
jgi:hypothetical protein